MYKITATIVSSVVAYCVTSSAVLAQAAHSNAGGNGNGWAYGHSDRAVSSVPEIDASSGALALAAVAAMLLLSYELRKRRAQS